MTKFSDGQTNDAARLTLSAQYQFNKIFPLLRKKKLENLISASTWVCQALIWATKLILEVPAVLDVRHCSKFQS